MTKEKCYEVLLRYENTLNHAAAQNVELNHLRTMIPQMHQMLNDIAVAEEALAESGDGVKGFVLRVKAYEAKREKFMRWLGFMQGTFWSMGIYTIEQLKHHNRAEDD